MVGRLVVSSKATSSTTRRHLYFWLSEFQQGRGYHSFWRRAMFKCSDCVASERGACSLKQYSARVTGGACSPCCTGVVPQFVLGIPWNAKWPGTTNSRTIWMSDRVSFYGPRPTRHHYPRQQLVVHTVQETGWNFDLAICRWHSTSRGRARQCKKPKIHSLLIWTHVWSKY